MIDIPDYIGILTLKKIPDFVSTEHLTFKRVRVQKHFISVRQSGGTLRGAVCISLEHYLVEPQKAQMESIHVWNDLTRVIVLGSLV